MINILKKQKGISLIETLFYVAIFSLVCMVVINSMISIMKALDTNKKNKEIMQSSEIMERISREIKQAESIHSIESNFNNLKILTTDESNTTKIVEFNLTDSNVRFLEDENFVGNLNSSNIKVVSLVFKKITTINSSAVKVFLSVSHKNDLSKVYNFYNTIILRGSY